MTQKGRVRVGVYLGGQSLVTPPPLGEEPGSPPANRVRRRSTGDAQRWAVDLVRRVVEEALEMEGWERPASIDVYLVGDEQMREVNATRRGVDESADVLSFPLLEARSGGAVPSDFFVLPPRRVQDLGDVLVSLDRVAAQAEELGHPRERELAYLTLHGVLHILGYDHGTPKQRRLMREREETILGRLGLSRA